MSTNPAADDDYNKFLAMMSSPPNAALHEACSEIEALALDWQRPGQARTKQQKSLAERIDSRIRRLREITKGWGWRDNHRPVAIDGLKMGVLGAFLAFDTARTHEHLTILCDKARELANAMQADEGVLNDAFPGSRTSSDFTAIISPSHSASAQPAALAPGMSKPAGGNGAVNTFTEPKLNPTKEAILKMCRKKALPGKAIARALELSVTHTRRVLASLRKMGLLDNGPDGYRTVRGRSRATSSRGRAT